MTELFFNVLLIENDRQQESLMHNMLTAAGCNSVRVNVDTFEQLLQRLLTYPSDVIVCAASRSDMVIDALRRFKRPLPVIFLGTPTEVPLPAILPAFDIVYLTMPFSANGLNAILQLLVRFEPKRDHIDD